MKDSLALKAAGALLDFAAFVSLARFVAAHGWIQAPALASVSPAVALAAFAVAVFGAAEIIVTSEVAYPLSKLASKIPVVGPALYREEVVEDAPGKLRGVPKGMLACHLCVGMWAGAALAAAGIAVWPIGWAGIMVHGMMGAALADGIHMLLDSLSSSK